MIKKFNQYNEGLTDHMKPKSEEELEIGKKNLLSEIKGYSQNPEIGVESLFYYLGNVIKSDKEIISTLIDNGFHSSDILYSIMDDIDNLPEDKKLEKMKTIYDIIEKNIDNIDYDDLE